jgi:hypothetical protein
MFNRIILKFTAAAVLAAATLLGTAANATAVTATASFTDLTLTGLTASNDQYLLDASTPFFSATEAGSVLTPYNLNTSLPAGISIAQIDSTFDPAWPSTFAAATTKGEGHATVLWSFDWTATTTGLASIRLEYLFNATIADLNPGDRAVARSYASLLLEGSALTDSALYFFDSVEGDAGGFRNLGLSFAVTAGQKGTFTMALNSDALVAPVPVPAALPLLASGLLGLAGLRRRRKTVA